uniref:Sugar phosphate transporter domain-containing protein n=1 Tax=Ditylum brightwellii TaxID=49249 RepID=A0A6V2LB42_9STRA|mmetsp:Transcript_22199/g.29300  ORF Transcript_22199/g.29300 Transcript_22199/m.29300 type:complete len:866 (-) Transcript_22199:225-2822(-)
MVSPELQSLPLLSPSRAHHGKHVISTLLPPAMLIFVWWGCSAWNAVAAKQILQRGSAGSISNDGTLLRLAVVSAASNILGVVLPVMMCFMSSSSSQQVQWIRHVPNVGWGLAASHAIGLYAAYRGLVGAKVSAVQAVKALEPLIAMTMSATPFFSGGREHTKLPEAQSILAAMVVTVGVVIVCVDDRSYDVEALFWVLISSFVTQGRNQLMKARQRFTQVKCDKNKDDDVGVDKDSGTDDNDAPSLAIQGCLIFITTSAGAFFVNLAMVLAELIFRPCDIRSALGGNKTWPIFITGITHFLYNLASFGVLSFVVPATHSLANTAKRAVIVCASAYFLSDRLTTKACFGLVLVITGSGYYSYSSKSKKSSVNTNQRHFHAIKKYSIPITLTILIIVITQFWFFEIGEVRFQNNMKKEETKEVSVWADMSNGGIKVSAQKNHNDLSTMEIRPRERKNKVLFYNRYRPEQLNKENLSLTEALAITAGNVGNLVWQYGATNLIDLSVVEVVDRFYGSSTNLGAKDVDAVIFPVANILGNRSLYDKDFAFNGRDMIRQTTIAILASDSPTLMLGMGSQAFFHPATEDKLEFELDLDPNGQIISTPEMYKLHEVHLQLMNVISQYTDSFFVRGSYTEKVCHNHGFQKAMAIGCPSLLISPNPQLGVSLKSNFDKLRKKPLKRVAINLPPYYAPKLITLFLGVLQKYPGSKIILQDNRDIKTLDKAKEELGIEIPKSDLVYFYNVPEWHDYICSKFDAVFGGRIHGSMMGIECALPTVIVAPDMRVLELAKVMLIPHTDIFDPRLTSHFDLGSFLTQVGDNFDALAFDTNRCQAARVYVEWMEKHNVPPNPALYKLCGTSSYRGNIVNETGR